MSAPSPELLKAFTDWFAAGSKEPLHSGVWAEIDTSILTALRESDYDTLCKFRSVLSSLAHDTLDRLKDRGLSVAEIQMVGIPVRCAYVRTALLRMEKEDPNFFVPPTVHGHEMLSVLSRSDLPMTALAIQQCWHSEPIPTAGWIAHTAAVLEDGGLVMRLGVSRGRRIELLPPGRDWITSHPFCPASTNPKEPK